MGGKCGGIRSFSLSHLVQAFEQHQSSSGPHSCCHSHLDDSLCGRFMRRQHQHRPACPQNGPSGLGRLNGCSSAISGWDLTEEWGEAEAELYASRGADAPPVYGRRLLRHCSRTSAAKNAPNCLWRVIQAQSFFPDGLNAWQLVSELADATGQPAAASFKHVSPAGAAIGVPLNDSEAHSLMVADLALDQRRHSLAVALARARGTDRMSSFGDFIALSQKCDELTARIISREVSDGVIAPDYEEAALSMLAKKKNGNYVILKIDPKFLPAEDEVRTIFGLKLKQKRNTAPLSTDAFSDVAVGNGDEITQSTVDDLLVACVAVKYAQSNAVCFAHRGQVVGMGAGQQSRVNCTRLAGEKMAIWWLRQHPRVLALPWRANVRRTEKANIVDAIVAGVREELSPRSSSELRGVNERQWNHYFTEPVEAFTLKERREWLSQLDGVCVASESPFHSRDNIDLAKMFGAKFVVTPSGGANDEQICDACEERGLVLIHTAGPTTQSATRSDDN